MVKHNASCLGLPCLFNGSVSLLRLFASETSPREPVLLVTSSGADPSQELADAATSEKRVYREVAMGQGQSQVALDEVTAAAQSGGWVCLKNLHLMTHWLPDLEKHINSLMGIDIENEGEATEKGRAPHPDFRLWLTTEPHANFPTTLLRSCLKVTYEVKKCS